MDPLLAGLNDAERERLWDFFGHDRERLITRVMIGRGETCVRQVQREFQQKANGFITLSTSSLYSILDDMKALHLIRLLREESVGGRGRKRRYYAVTDLGKAALREYEAATAHLRQPVSGS